MSTLTVGAGQQYSTLAAAVAASHNGDVIKVQAGTYTNDFATVTDSITIEGVGGLVNLVATEPPPNQKGILTIGTAGSSPTVTLDDLEFSGAAISAGAGGNAAGVRYQAGNLTIENSYFHNNQNGLLADGDAAGSITITNSEFADNGTTSGLTHNIYVGAVGSFSISGSYVTAANTGNEIQSRALVNSITNNRIVDGPTATASYSINLPNGGVDTVSGNIIEQGPHSQNYAMINFGGATASNGGTYANSSLSITGNTILNDEPVGSARAVVNNTSTPVGFTQNSVYGLTAAQLASGPVAASGTTYLKTEPAISSAPPYSTTSASSGPAAVSSTGSQTSGTGSQTSSTGSTAASGSSSGTTTPAPNANTVTIASSNADPVELVSNSAINASAGNHMLFIGGTGDTATLTGGTETVQAFQGGNTITTGTGSDTIHIAGSGNVVNAGTGNNAIYDSGSGNTIVLPGASGGDDDVFGYVLQNSDKLDLRAALASTNWNGTEGVLGNYLSVATVNNNAVITLHPAGGSAGSAIATLEGSGAVTLATLLQHAIT